MMVLLVAILPLRRRDYQVLIGRPGDDLCPDCGNEPQTGNHVFSCPSFPTRLAADDLCVTTFSLSSSPGGQNSRSTTTTTKIGDHDRRPSSATTTTTTIGDHGSRPRLQLPWATPVGNSRGQLRPRIQPRIQRRIQRRI